MNVRTDRQIDRQMEFTDTTYMWGSPQIASGADTHTHTHRHLRAEAILRNQARTGLRQVHTWFKN